MTSLGALSIANLPVHLYRTPRADCNQKFRQCGRIAERRSSLVFFPVNRGTAARLIYLPVSAFHAALSSQSAPPRRTASATGSPANGVFGLSRILSGKRPVIASRSSVFWKVHGKRGIERT